MSKDISKESMSTKLYMDRIRVGRGWISKQKVDAIVMLMPQNLEHKDPINEEIEDAAGERFRQAVHETVLEPKPCDLFVLDGADLPAKHVFIGILPVWRTEFDRQDKMLSTICAQAVAKAYELDLESLAFPLLQGGAFGFPKKRAVRLMVQGVVEHIRNSAQDNSLFDIRFVCDEKADMALFKERLLVETAS